ncbi:hypothetical protein [Hansschlegelia plantiphila]|uniref:Uncharacterized protein n=1 Tax=Hansschlegelia plantiphila TaxID=374655 RepID=A0A9W6J040_9HYPH|nr:hypothetical protein [Hansschlegelia plantiphila]GLK68326.1 hypothetical protein GCM10008179_19640 [Hansschlegelia plantiphila]
MAKAQKRGNKEAKKPKKVKEAAPAPASFLKGATTPQTPGKKKA